MESKNINVFLTIFYIEMFGVFIYKINPLTNQVFDLISTCENVLDFNLLALILSQSIYAVYTITYRLQWKSTPIALVRTKQIFSRFEQ